MRIGIVAPSASLSVEDANRVIDIAAISHPDADLIFHPQCHKQSGHFAGTDAERLSAFVEMANNPDLDAIWFARGGYGACRIVDDAIPLLGEAARAKTFMGYSDQGYLLAALYKHDFDQLFHGPMPVDIVRDGGEAALKRGLDWLLHRDPAALEPSIVAGQKYAPFNLSVLSGLLGTANMPKLNDHILMVEEVSEYHYRIDRMMCQIAGNLGDDGLKAMKMGRISDILENDRPFGFDADQIFVHWLEKAGIPNGGAVDIGHDISNKIVPYGALES